MATNPIISGENKQVTVYHTSGAVSTAQEGVRQNDPGGISELERRLASGTGWSLTPPEGSGGSSSASSPFTEAKGYGIGVALYKFFPEAVLNNFAKEWAKYGDANIALATTRQTPEWKKEFGYLEREDGSLIMSELEAVGTKATYRETLAEVGITDTSEFEGKFNELITGEVSAQEFQSRIDTVYTAVKDNIPQVEQLFRERFQIDSDAPTIFAALINPDIEDKLLKGELKTLGIAGEAYAAGFTGSFNRFDQLRKAGLSQEGARDLYQSAGIYDTMGTQTGTDIGLATLEEAAIGDVEAKKALNLLGADAAAMSSGKVGAARKGGKYTGLVQN